MLAKENLLIKSNLSAELNKCTIIVYIYVLIHFTIGLKVKYAHYRSTINGDIYKNRSVRSIVTKFI